MTDPLTELRQHIRNVEGNVTGHTTRIEKLEHEQTDQRRAAHLNAHLFDQRLTELEKLEGFTAERYHGRIEKLEIEHAKWTARVWELENDFRRLRDESLERIALLQEQARKGPPVVEPVVRGLDVQREATASTVRWVYWRGSVADVGAELVESLSADQLRHLSSLLYTEAMAKAEAEKMNTQPVPVSDTLARVCEERDRAVELLRGAHIVIHNECKRSYQRLYDDIAKYLGSNE